MISKHRNSLSPLDICIERRNRTRGSHNWNDCAWMSWAREDIDCQGSWLKASETSWALVWNEKEIVRHQVSQYKYQFENRNRKWWDTRRLNFEVQNQIKETGNQGEVHQCRLSRRPPTRKVLFPTLRSIHWSILPSQTLKHDAGDEFKHFFWFP